MHCCHINAFRILWDISENILIMYNFVSTASSSQPRRLPLAWGGGGGGPYEQTAKIGSHLWRTSWRFFSLTRWREPLKDRQLNGRDKRQQQRLPQSDSWDGGEDICDVSCKTMQLHLCTGKPFKDWYIGTNTVTSSARCPSEKVWYIIFKHFNCERQTEKQKIQEITLYNLKNGAKNKYLANESSAQYFVM